MNNGKAIAGLRSGVAAAAGAVCLGALTGLVALNVELDQRCLDMRANYRAGVAEVEARSYGRPVLHGEAVSGNAWKFYDELTAGFPAGLDNREAFFLFIDAGRESFLPQVLVEINAHAEAPKLVRRGAQSTEARRSRNWETRWGDRRSPLGRYRDALLVTTARAAERMTAGDPAEAVRTLLDALQFAADLKRAGTVHDELVSGECMGHALAVARRWLEEGKLSAKHLEVLAEGLSRLESSLVPLGEVWRNDQLSMDGAMRSVSDYRLILLIESTSAERARFFGEMRNACVLPWKEFLSRATALRDEAERTVGRLFRSRIKGVLKVAQMRRASTAHLRIVRAAATIRLTGEFPATAPENRPQDPFGEGPLGYRREADGSSCLIWSVGPDGVDNGGEGEWEGRRGRDIVLRLTN